MSSSGNFMETGRSGANAQSTSESAISMTLETRFVHPSGAQRGVPRRHASAPAAAVAAPGHPSRVQSREGAAPHAAEPRQLRSSPSRAALVFEGLARGVRRMARRYRADAVPLPLLPAFLLYGYGVGTLLFVCWTLTRWLSKLEYTGVERLVPGRNYIFATWHEFSWASMIAFRSDDEVWLCHPAWYMKPMHVLLRLIGVTELILGSTGNSGRAAADALLAHLRAGASTSMAPDGPAGPARQLRKGILHLSAQSGVPIVPLRVECSRSVTLGGWDRKLVPLPFGRVRVCYGAPIRVDARALDDAARTLRAALCGARP